MYSLDKRKMGHVTSGDLPLLNAVVAVAFLCRQFAIALDLP